MERKGVVTVKGDPVTLVGEEIKVGQKAPDFTLLDSNLNEIKLEKFKDKIKLIATVPSLDTPICDLQIKRFNDEAAEISKDIVIIFVSMDLPFAQKRFCQAYSIKKVKTLSDHRDADFAVKYGVLIKGLRLLSRSIFILDNNNDVQYVEYVQEIASHPDYEAALKALSSI
jgi:thioredoxin-dependent peroxiredoxin